MPRLTRIKRGRAGAWYRAVLLGTVYVFTERGVPYYQNGMFGYSMVCCFSPRIIVAARGLCRKMSRIIINVWSALYACRHVVDFINNG